MRQGTGFANKGLTLRRALLRTARYHLADLLGFRVRPRKLRLVATKRCNARCLMCSAWKGVNPSASEIDPDEIRTIAQRNRHFLARVTHLSVTGGEPTLRRDLVELVRALTDSFPRASLNINTNGFDTRRIVTVARKILGFRRRLTVMVSVDGLGEVHNTIRGVRGVFPHVVETIDQLIALRERNGKVRVEINFVLTNRNSDQMLPVFHFCREREVAFNPIYPVYGQLYENDEAEIGLERHAVRRFLRDLFEIQQADGALALRELEHQLRGFPRDFDCWAGRTILFVESDARVFPNGGCPPIFCLGNLREFGYSFAALLRSPNAQQVLRRLRTCRLCRLPCESMTTLSGPEALAGYRKIHRPDAYPTSGELPVTRLVEHPPRQRTP